MDIMSFLQSVLGQLSTASELPIFTIIGSVFLMVLLDGIITFLFGGLTILFKGRK